MGLVADFNIKNNFAEVTEELAEKIEAWLEAVGEDAASTAAEVAPVDTGRLKNSITCASPIYQSDPNKYGGKAAEITDFIPLGKPEEGSVYIGTNVEYAEYNEMGTSKGVPARHFIQFGMTAHQDEYKKMLEEKLKE